jgi:hypothetical protein
MRALACLDHGVKLFSVALEGNVNIHANKAFPLGHSAAVLPRGNIPFCPLDRSLFFWIELWLHLRTLGMAVRNCSSLDFS